MGRFKHLQYGLLGLLTVLLCVAGRPAIAHFPTAIPTATWSVAQEPGVLAQAVASPEQQAQAAYDQGQYQAAAEWLQQAQQQYQTQGETVRAAIALSNLCLTYQQLGNWSAAEEALTQAWNRLENQRVPQGIQAQILDVQGQLHFARGEAAAALTTWQQTADLYTQLGDRPRQSLSRLHQAQALQAQGLFQQVFRTLEDLANDLADEPDSAMKATILRQLGDSLRATGHFAQAGEVLQDSFAIAEGLQNNSLMAATALSLGNLEQGKLTTAFERKGRELAQRHAQASLRYYQQVVDLAEGELGIQARLNLMRLLTSPIVAQWDQAIAFYPTIQERLAQLPPGRTAIYGYTGLAENLIALKQQSDRAEPSWAEVAELLVPAQAQAEALGDVRSQSLVLGTLGYVYEQTGQWDAAEALSRRALALAQPIRADDISYRWQWQLGRMLKTQAQPDAAISAYTNAFETLKGLRSDLVTANADVQFSFRESVEPVYRELVDLLLASVPDLQSEAQVSTQSKAQVNSNRDQNQVRLRQARDVMEDLQVAELENFFQAACIEKTVSIDQVVNEKDTTAAVVYAILLEDRLELVLKLPQQNDLVHYAASASRRTVDNTLRQFRMALTSGVDAQAYGEQVYDWLLKPAADQGLLSPDTIKTLIFVLDGDLRLIPMATLHDGEDFLVQKYALSLILGLEVRDPQTLPTQDQLQVLAASLTHPPAVEARTYGPLPNVNIELDKIADANLPTTLLKDQAFTREALNRQLSQTDYTIVHLATHGQFGSDRQNTFILAADGRINIDTLGQVFESRRQAAIRLEMLILSACKTATGDSREVLGIAGATVQAGARSTIATLWSVDDTASVLFAETLYANLGKPGISRAEALRQAQVTLMEQYPGRPRYWAPYVLVGSWR
ncbi:MAG: CHAT domain-containing protein [Leptolyngbya sp. SIO1D8]|nr:CHAT domain-containing protein [Leptolyngbya sp. SIO1D8]